MVSYYKDFIVEIIDEPNYSFGSVDNSFVYDIEYFDKMYTYEFGSKHGIRISCNGEKIRSAIISGHGGQTGIHVKSYSIKNDAIFICCGSSIYSLTIPSLKLNWTKELDMVTCFGIYEFENDFIIHGEIDISRLTPGGDIKWQFSGRDIFVNIENKKEFEIAGDVIKLTDFGNFTYILDGNGKEIKKSN